MLEILEAKGSSDTITLLERVDSALLLKKIEELRALDVNSLIPDDLLMTIAQLVLIKDSITPENIGDHNYSTGKKTGYFAASSKLEEWIWGEGIKEGLPEELRQLINELNAHNLGINLQSLIQNQESNAATRSSKEGIPRSIESNKVNSTNSIVPSRIRKILSYFGAACALSLGVAHKDFLQNEYTKFVKGQFHPRQKSELENLPEKQELDSIFVELNKNKEDPNKGMIPTKAIEALTKIVDYNNGSLITNPAFSRSFYLLLQSGIHSEKLLELLQKISSVKHIVSTKVFQELLIALLADNQQKDNDKILLILKEYQSAASVAIGNGTKKHIADNFPELHAEFVRLSTTPLNQGKNETEHSRLVSLIAVLAQMDIEPFLTNDLFMQSDRVDVRSLALAGIAAALNGDNHQAIRFYQLARQDFLRLSPVLREEFMTSSKKMHFPEIFYDPDVIRAEEYHFSRGGSVTRNFNNYCLHNLGIGGGLSIATKDN